MIEYLLPIWNGIKEKPGVSAAKLKINYSDFYGIYRQTGKRIIVYEKNYNHMTPLKGSNYIEKLRKGKIDWILNRISKCKKILEIGGGDSSNYNHFDCEKYTIIDPSIKQSEKKSKLTLIPDYFENVTLNEKYDLVLLISVLEHVDDPHLIIEKAYNVLKDDGSMYVFIPIIDKQFAIGDFNALIHEHMSYFTYIGAKNLFKRNNLLIDNYFFKNDGGFFKLIKGESELDKNENYDLENISYTFNYQYNKFRDLVSNGERILFYGATNGLNNLGS
jgi:SAM-dependent methyltransferase